jgi:hypothetical protein
MEYLSNLIRSRRHRRWLKTTTGINRQDVLRSSILLLLTALNPVLNPVFNAASAPGYNEPYESMRLGRDPGENNSRLFADQSGLPQGGIIIVSSAEGDDHKLVNLAHYLTNYGWTSLITALPRRSTDENKPNIMSDANILGLAIRFMQEERGQFNLVLMALNDTWPRLYGDTLAGNPSLQALILLDVDGTTTIEGLPKAMPLLDISTQRLTPLKFASRKIQAQRFRLTEYQQVSLSPTSPSLTLKGDRFSKRVRGWLLRHVQGMEYGSSAR